MIRVAALLAAVLTAVAFSACGGDGAEPGAPKGATLVLDFQPNAVHAGLYAAKARGYFSDEGIDLDIREPSGTADGAKLLAAGRADFAILDINDFGIARERGLDIVAIAAIVQRPLASVIAGDRNEIRTPADLEGKTIGVTGVPSDDAVLDTILAEGGVDPDSVDRKVIGFNAVPFLASGRVDAATAFWNAEGVELKRMGVPTREFRVDEFGAPRYPELVIAARREETDLSCRLYAGLSRGYAVMRNDPESALGNLLNQDPELDADSQRAQFDALTAAHAFNALIYGKGVRIGDLTPRFSELSPVLWVNWAERHGIVKRPSTGRPLGGFRLSGCFARAQPAGAAP
jgi:NitT/TauT family transport system substrate-binding protein/putative hydroxymethylpyrimidine transport system substrate-binding protein